MNRKEKRLLVIYSAEWSYVPTTFHYVDAFHRHSRFQVSYLDVAADLPTYFDFSHYDAVWINYCARLLFDHPVPEAIKIALATYPGPKLVAVQDEYEHTNRLREQLLRVGADVVLTCVPQESVEYVYPRSMFPNTRFETVLTGYVADELSNGRGTRPLAERPIIIGYRGRNLIGRYGDLGRQKAEVGLRVREACLRRGIPCDIEVDEGSRIYGFAWSNFIGSCRVMLGSESGSNVFDFDGSILERWQRMKDC